VLVGDPIMVSQIDGDARSDATGVHEYGTGLWRRPRVRRRPENGCAARMQGALGGTAGSDDLDRRAIVMISRGASILAFAGGTQKCEAHREIREACS